MSHAPEPADDPHVLGPGLLPTPFTADEIRAATGRGKTIRILVEAPGGVRFERINRFTDCDGDGATLARWRLTAVGAAADAVDGEIARGRVAWRELQGHAAFPADRTTVVEETVELPLGRLACLRYDTRDRPDDPVETFWVAREHPGMPVRYEVPTPGGVERSTVVSIERAG
ncbi:hypothetical protein ABIQ69_00845 [Agromyces sp. G08B096]|uniref:Uncharacterized protein n=1 Tax=Agromyces sp. G08B096 TaxID=3156399 RepID=A0AAU7W7T1_9MICO